MKPETKHPIAIQKSQANKKVHLHPPMGDYRGWGLLSVANREFRRMISRPIYLIITLLIPLFCYIFFVSLLHRGMPQDMPVGIVDLDNSSLSRMISQQIDATQQAHVIGKYNSYTAARSAMQKGEIYAFVLIPQYFQADVMAGRQPNVPFYTEYAHYVPGSLLMKDLTLTLGSISGGVNLKMQLAKGQTEAAAMAQIQPIVTDLNEMGNPWVNYSVYFSTTFLPGLLQLMILLTTIYVIGIELKQKTSRQWLLSANKSMPAALLGKLLPYSLIFILLAIFGNVILFKYLKFPFVGSFGHLCVGSILFVLAQQALGVLIIGLVPVLRDSLSIAAILGTLAISFSGLTFPIEGMMKALQSWSLAFPLRHYYLIYVSEALTGGGIAAAWTSYLVLLIFLTFPFLVGLRLKKALVRQNYPLG